MKHPALSRDAAQKVPQTTSLSPEDVSRWRWNIRADVLGNYHEQMGVALARQGDTAAAIEAFRRALEANPRQFGTVYQLAALYRRIGKTDLAADVLARACTIDADAELLGRIACARSALEAGEWADAERQMTEALTASQHAQRHGAEVLLEIGRKYRMDGQFNIALQWLDRAAPFSAENTLFYFEYGLTLFNLGDGKGGIQSLQTCVERNPDWGIAHYFLGTFLSCQFQFDEACLHFERVIAAGGDLAKSGYVQLGRTHHLAGRLDAALEACNAALKQAPDWQQGLLHRGLCLLHRGDVPGATADIEKAVSITPNAAALAHRAILRLTTGQPDQAMADFETALRTNPAHTVSRLGLACVQLATGHREAAATGVAAAIRGEPQAVGVSLRLLGLPGEPLKSLFADAGYDGPL